MRRPRPGDADIWAEVTIKQKLRSLISSIVNLRARSESHQNGAVVCGRDVENLHLVRFGGDNGVGRGTIFAGNDLCVGRATTIGANCLINGPVTIGNFCQFGTGVGIFGKDHPTSYMTTYIGGKLFGGRLKSHSRSAQVNVGHDVWMGHGAIVLKGVHVGNGAIIGAGAVLTRSVPDYAIVVGNPASVLRYRFSPVVIDLLMELEWWSLPPHDLEALEPLFNIDFKSEEERGIELLREAIASRKGLSSPKQT